MIKNIALILAFFIPLSMFSQVKSVVKQKNHNSRNLRLSFDDYCEKEAISFLVIPETKNESFTINGEIELLKNPDASYLDYGIELKENETQYFRLIGTEKVLAAKSLYVLRLNYANQQNQTK